MAVFYCTSQLNAVVNLLLSNWIFTRESRMLRASLPSSGRPSIRLSRSWSVSKRCKLGSRNLHCGCPKVSSLSWQNFVPLGAGVPLERGRQRRVPPKKRHLAVIGSNNVKTVADRYIHASYHNKHWWQAFGFINIDDLERPWTPQKGVFSEFFCTILRCNTHFKSELRQNGWR